MRVPFLLLLVFLALLTSSAETAAPQQEGLVAKWQNYAKEASQRAQEHLATIQQSEVVQQVREWVQAGSSKAKEILDRVKSHLTTAWERKTSSA